MSPIQSHGLYPTGRSLLAGLGTFLLGGVITESAIQSSSTKDLAGSTVPSLPSHHHSKESSAPPAISEFLYIPLSPLSMLVATLMAYSDINTSSTYNNASSSASGSQSPASDTSSNISPVMLTNHALPGGDLEARSPTSGRITPSRSRVDAPRLTASKDGCWYVYRLIYGCLN